MESVKGEPMGGTEGQPFIPIPRSTVDEIISALQSLTRTLSATSDPWRDMSILFGSATGPLGILWRGVRMHLIDHFTEQALTPGNTVHTALWVSIVHRDAYATSVRTAENFMIIEVLPAVAAALAGER